MWAYLFRQATELQRLHKEGNEMQRYFSKRNLRFWLAWLVGLILFVILGLIDGDFDFEERSLAYTNFFWLTYCMGLSLRTVFIAFFIGLLLNHPAISNIWNNRIWLASLILVTGFIIFLFSYNLGLVPVEFEPGSNFIIRSPTRAFVAIFLIAFSITNWPYRIEANI